MKCAWFMVVLVLTCGGATNSKVAQAATRPNILFILADDLAWNDLGCYGHPWHRTPNLDRLAREGLRFTQAYAPAPICSASRASILTGKTPARLGFEFVTKNEPGKQHPRPGQALQTPPFTLELPLGEKSIAEYLTESSYETAFFGKWHLNAHHEGQYLAWSPTHGPAQHGFETAEEDFGSHPYSYRKDGSPRQITRRGEFPADSMTQRAVDFIKQPHARPYFLMASHFYVHTPIRTPCTWLVDECEARVPQDTPNRRQRVQYAAFVETLDHYVGELLTAVDAAGQRDKTLVVFTSDNGGHPQFAANGPLRGSKWNLYEGGIRVPLMARWPAAVAAGTSSSAPVVGYDLLPTLVAIAGGKALDDAAIDGVSLEPLLRGDEKQPSRALYWHFPYYHPEGGFGKALREIGVNDFAVSQTRPHSAIRSGPHKFLYFVADNRGELYNLNDDPGESHDLSAAEPALSDGLRRQLLTYLKTVGARMPTALPGRSAN